MRSLTTKETKLKDQLLKKVKDVEQKRIETEGQRDLLKTEIARLEREIEAQRRQVEMDKKNIEDMAREKDLLQNNLRKTQTATQKQADLVKVQENKKESRVGDHRLQVGGAEATQDDLLTGKGARKVWTTSVRRYCQVPRGA